MQPSWPNIAGLIACLFLTASAVTAQTRQPVSPAGGSLLPPAPLPDKVELFNSLSGLYSELIQTPKDLNFQRPNLKYTDVAPLPGTPVNEYGRLSWHSLETSEGEYDFSILDNVLEPCASPDQPTCLPAGTKFGFRIMAMNPQTGSDTNVTTGDDGYPVYADVPAYLETGAHGWLLPVDPQDKTQGHYFIPDWNDPFFLERVDALLSALGHRYDGDPRIGWIDIGLYGSWGEWHTAGLPDQADYKGAIPYKSSSTYYSLNTQAWSQNHGGQSGAYEAGSIASKDFIIDAHVSAFAHTQLLMLSDDGDGVCHALQLPDPAHIGVRRDSLGAADFTYQFPDQLPDCDSAADQQMINTRWQTAPFIVEPYGNGSSPTFPCQTFTVDATTGSYDLFVDVEQYHVAAVKNASFCNGPWSALTWPEQQAVLWTGTHAGYRFVPEAIYVDASARKLSLSTYWSNTGSTPAYNPWSVQFSLWSSSPLGEPHEVARFQSAVDLRKVLPTGNSPLIIRDSFALPGNIFPGSYTLRMTVLDPDEYMAPMQLALQNRMANGDYLLGTVVIQ